MPTAEIPGEVPFHGPSPITERRLQWLSPFVRQSGDDYRHNWKMGNRRVLDYLLVLFPDGGGEATIGGDHFTLDAGDLLWVPPNTDHSMSGSCRCLFIHCDLIYSPTRSHWNAYIPSGTVDLSSWPGRMHPPLPDKEIVARNGKLISPASPAIHTLFSTICRTHSRDKDGSDLILSAMVAQLIGLLIKERSNLAQKSKPWNDVMRHAANDVRKSIGTSLNVAGMARRFGLSTSHFRKLFKEYHGIAPGAMHRQQRIDNACSRLIYSSQSVSEIADALGYDCIHTFSRAFKDAMGMSPLNFRRAR
jgi:AraC-like DNA-binding protein